MTTRITAAELASLIGAKLEGPGDVVVTSAAPADDAGPNTVVCAEDQHYLDMAIESGAGCIVAGPAAKAPADRALLRTDDPQAAFIKLLQFFKDREPRPDVGVSKGAVIEQGAQLGADVAVGSNSYVGKDAIIGDGTVIYPNVFIGAGVKLGKQCVIYPQAAVYPNCSLGDRVTLHAGVVIGADGFGYASIGDTRRKFPHVGTVQIGDDVEIGANSTVDRAKVGATVIGSGTKIDNLVHIAHNVKIGRNCVIVAQSGVAGSAEIGDGVTLAAQSGVKDHVRVGDGCVVAARGGVIGDLAERSVVSGFPARDHRVEMRMQAMQMRLPELMERLRTVERELRTLKTRRKSSEE